MGKQHTPCWIKSDKNMTPCEPFQMLKDLPRCKWYKAEIERACSHIKNAVVLDVGSGTGLLSLFAARAGAKKVYAVEANPKMARLTEAVVAANGMQDIISVIAGSLEDISLPEQVNFLFLLILLILSRAT